jgi:predicted methyltransferase
MPRFAPVLCALLALLALPSWSAADLAAKLADEARSTDDRARDAGRQPAGVIAFLEIEPGDTVVDLIAAGGYYTEVLSLAVGPKGKVYAQNGEYVLKMRDGANDKAMTARLADGRLPNVERLDREVADLGLAAGSIDAAVTALNFHDIYNGRSPEAAAAFLATVYAFLRPGGVLGLIDHAGDAGADNAELHRIEEQRVREAAIAAGFEVKESPLLRNLADDHTQQVFAPEIRGKTDRFLMRLRKPVE